MSAERPDERELKDARLSQVYRESRAPEPSAEIDQAILAAARREVHAGPRRPGHWMRRWRVPVSIAATIVVSATLVMVVVDEGGHRLHESPPVASAPALKEAPAPQAAPATSPSPEPSNGRAERPGDAPSSPSTHAESDSAAERQQLKSLPKREPAPEARAAAESPRAQPAPPPAALARPFPAPPPAPEAAPRAEAEDRAAPRPESTAPRAAEAPPRDAPAGRTGGGLQAERARADDAGSGTPRLGVRGFTDAPLAEGQQATPSQDAIGRAGSSEPQKARGPDTYAQERGDPAATATAPAPAAKRAPAPKPKPESRGAVLARDLVDQPPEKWLERAEQLRREHRDSDADHLMAEFRRRFPDHPAAHRAP